MPQRALKLEVNSESKSLDINNELVIRVDKCCHVVCLYQLPGSLQSISDGFYDYYLTRIYALLVHGQTTKNQSRVKMFTRGESPHFRAFRIQDFDLYEKNANTRKTQTTQIRALIPKSGTHRVTIEHSM